MSRCDKTGKRTPMTITEQHATRVKSTLVWLRLANERTAKGSPLRAQARRATLLALAGLAVAGCDLHSDYYTHMSSQYIERRDTVSMGGGDAVASNKVLQMQDPWPVASANRNLPMHGHVAASAMERYRTGKVIVPVGMNTSSTNYQSQAQGSSGASSLSAPPVSTPSQAAP
jgi:hypothetical protein